VTSNGQVLPNISLARCNVSASGEPGAGSGVAFIGVVGISGMSTRSSAAS